MNRLVIITGSSRGIGAAIAHEFNTRFPCGCLFVLIARDTNKLNEVRTSLVKNSRNRVLTISLDMSTSHQKYSYLESMRNLLENENLTDFEELYAIYNHGTLEYGSIGEVAENLSMHIKFETNLFSIWRLLAAIKELIPVDIINKQYYVNISSGYSEEPTANWSLHCCARASRDMLFKCLALEEPNIRVLNYEPGIVYTDMLKEACTYSNDYQEGYDSGKYIKPEQTAQKLLNILQEDAFNSGSKFKFYDS